MVTINPARELGLDHRLGSIEPGKDADVALFNGHPLDATSRCELALIDGEVWFQRKAVDKAAPAGNGKASNGAAPTAPASARAKVVDIPASPRGVYALTGATVHPVSGPDVPNGTVVVSDGRVLAVGGPDTIAPEGAVTVDLKGLDVWPGMVDAGSPVGLTEIASLPETQDSADSAQFQPELRAATALHTDSELIPVSRANGVLAAYVQPAGGVIAGQGCVVQLDGWVPPEMTLVDRAALNVNIPAHVSNDPDSPRRRFAALAGGGGGGDPNARRKEEIEAIKEQFRRALAYEKVKAAALARKEPPPTPDPRMEALAPYARGEKLVLLHADRRVEILDAIALARDLKLKAAITGASEAWKVADALKASGLPVLVAGTLSLPGRASDPYDAPYANPARLHAAGVPFAIRSGGRGPELANASRNLPYEAATAAAFGLPAAEALKAVTLYPARILGVDDRLGSIEAGKRANLVITAGHLLQPTTEVKALFIGGRPVAPESRHTRLFARYARRLDEVKSGAAPLGLDRPKATASAPAGGPGTPAESPGGTR
jgi:imidazolonepropionase-like amidohydrolase